MSQPNDRDEIEADQQAAKLVGEGGSSGPCCSACGAALTSRSDGASPTRSLPLATSTPPFVQQLGAGSGLDPLTRSFFEPKLGRDLSSVTLYQGPEAQRAAQSLNATAFAVGSGIALGRNAPPVGSHAGRRVLAHELMHVINEAGRPPAIHRVGPEDRPLAQWEIDQAMKQAAEMEARRVRHEQWEESHRSGHGAFLEGASAMSLSTDIGETKDRLVEQRMALLTTAAANAPKVADPVFAGFEPMRPSFFTAPTVIPVGMAAAWAMARQEVVVLNGLIKGHQFTADESDMARPKFLDFYKLLVPICVANDKANADQERMSQSLAASYRKQQYNPCPNCHSANPLTMPVFKAPAPDGPYEAQTLASVLGAKTDADWLAVLKRFETSTKTMDALALSTVATTDPAAAGFIFARDLLARQEELQLKHPEAIRIRAVFYPLDKFIKSTTEEGKEVEIANGIPWYFYLTHTPTTSETHYPDGFEWTLADITSPKRPVVSYRPSAVERYIRSGVLRTDQVPRVLFEKLNDKLVFPKGRLYWTFPDGREDSIRTTESWSISDWLGAIGMGIAGLALILASAGMATPAVLAGLGIASAAFGVASTLADLHEKSELGILTTEDKERAILFIAADIASALSLGLGHVASEMGHAAVFAGRVSKVTILVQRTAKVAATADKLIGKALMVTMAADFVGQYQAIANSNLSPAEREAALKELVKAGLFTGAVILAPRAVAAVGSSLRGRKPPVTHDPLNLRTGDLEVPAATVVRPDGEPQAGWSRPAGDVHFTQSTAEKEVLPPRQAAHELQAAQTRQAPKEIKGDTEFKKSLDAGNGHEWKEKANGSGWCRFSKGKCYTNAQLRVGVHGEGDRVTMLTKRDMNALLNELEHPPPGLKTDQDKLDWADYKFYADRRLKSILTSLESGQPLPAAPRTFESFKADYKPGSPLRNGIQGGRFEARSRRAIEEELGAEAADKVLFQPNLSESTAPTVAKGELTRPEAVFKLASGEAVAVSNKSRSSFLDASPVAVTSQVNRDLDEAMRKYTGAQQIRRTGEQIEPKHIWLLYDANFVPASARPTIEKAVKAFEKAQVGSGLTFEVSVF